MTTTTAVNPETEQTPVDTTEEEAAPKTIQEQIDDLDDELQTVLEKVFDKNHSGIVRANLDPSDYSPLFHQFVKLHAEQDKLMERADAEKLDEMVQEYGKSIQDSALLWREEVAESLNKDCTRVMVKFTEKDGKVTMELIPTFEDFPEILAAQEEGATPQEGQQSF